MNRAVKNRYGKKRSKKPRQPKRRKSKSPRSKKCTTKYLAEFNRILLEDSDSDDELVWTSPEAQRTRQDFVKNQKDRKRKRVILSDTE